MFICFGIGGAVILCGYACILFQMTSYNTISLFFSPTFILLDLILGGCAMVFLYVTAGIVLFLIVEKLVRYVEENSGGASGWSHGHHHHHHKSNKNLKKKDEDAAHRNSSQPLGDTLDDSLNADNATQPEIRKVVFRFLHWRSFVLTDFIQLRLRMHIF